VHVILILDVLCKYQLNIIVGQLHYQCLPRDIKDHHVILMDATISTGAAAMMAIRVLLDHDVPEENILLVSLIMAVSGNVLLFTLLVT